MLILIFAEVLGLYGYVALAFSADSQLLFTAHCQADRCAAHEHKGSRSKVLIDS